MYNLSYSHIIQYHITGVTQWVPDQGVMSYSTISMHAGNLKKVAFAAAVIALVACIPQEVRLPVQDGHERPYHLCMYILQRNAQAL